MTWHVVADEHAGRKSQIREDEGTRWTMNKVVKDEDCSEERFIKDLGLTTFCESMTADYQTSIQAYRRARNYHLLDSPL